jgi:hypothetical protein
VENLGSRSVFLAPASIPPETLAQCSGPHSFSNNVLVVKLRLSIDSHFAKSLSVFLEVVRVVEVLIREQ